MTEAKARRIWTLVTGIGCAMIVLGDCLVMIGDLQHKGRVKIILGGS